MPKKSSTLVSNSFSRGGAGLYDVLYLQDFKVWPLVTYNDLWPPANSLKLLNLISNIDMQSMRPSKVIFFELPCFLLFFVTELFTSTKLLNFLNSVWSVYVLNEIHHSLTFWNIMLMRFLQYDFWRPQMTFNPPPLLKALGIFKQENGHTHGICTGFVCVPQMSLDLQYTEEYGKHFAYNQDRDFALKRNVFCTIINIL